MIGTVIGWTYLIGLPVGFVLGTRYAYREAKNDDPRDIVMNQVIAVCAGVLVAMVWPIVFAVVALRGVLFESRTDRRIRELDEREQRIATMERELGIKR